MMHYPNVVPYHVLQDLDIVPYYTTIYIPVPYNILQ